MLPVLRDTVFRGKVKFNGDVDFSDSDGEVKTIINGASSDNDTAGKAVILDSGGTIQTAANVGVAPTGVTATEFGDGYIHTTTLAVALTNAIDVADNAARGDGSLIYTFPDGEIVIHAASLAIGTTLAEDSTNASAEIGLGTVVASGANAALGAVGATCEDILGPVTPADCNGAIAKIGKASGLYIADASAHTVYLNIASTWADTAGTDLTGDFAGIVTLVWSWLRNPA